MSAWRDIKNIITDETSRWLKKGCSPDESWGRGFRKAAQCYIYDEDALLEMIGDMHHYIKDDERNVAWYMNKFVIPELEEHNEKFYKKYRLLIE